MTRYYSHHHSAHNPPEVQARPPEQVQHLCAGRPAHQGDGKTITQILKTKTPDYLRTLYCLKNLKVALSS